MGKGAPVRARWTARLVRPCSDSNHPRNFWVHFPSRQKIFAVICKNAGQLHVFEKIPVKLEENMPLQKVSGRGRFHFLDYMTLENLVFINRCLIKNVFILLYFFHFWGVKSITKYMYIFRANTLVLNVGDGKLVFSVIVCLNF